MAKQLPVIWQPNGGLRADRGRRNLHGVTPLSTLNINPENWYFSKLTDAPVHRCGGHRSPGGTGVILDT